MKRYILLLLAVVTILEASYGQNPDRAKLDSLFNMLQQKNLGMGSIAISKNGKLIYRKAFGIASINDKDTTRADVNTEYRLGSITKMFTAVMAFQLIGEKKLSIHDTLSKYFPQLPNAGRITIGNLLNHRSGMANFTDNTNFDDWKTQPKTHQELLDLIIKQKPDFEPNAMANYCNSNYLVLGYIIEKICNKPYKDVLNDRIINKIGLKQTYYGDSTHDAKKEAASYKYFDSQWKKDKAIFLDDFGGAGAIISTPADMLKFINALFTGKLVNKSSLDTMETMVDGYGMGMFPFEFGPHKGFGHNGKTEGFASSLTYYPEDKLAIAYCTNGEVYHKAKILDGVLSIYFNKSYTTPTFQPVNLSDAVLDQYTGTYTSGPSGIKVICTHDGDHLQLETRGQLMKLEALGNNEFFNKGFGFFFEFDPSGKKLTIKDVESNYELSKSTN